MHISLSCLIDLVVNQSEIKLALLGSTSSQLAAPITVLR